MMEHRTVAMDESGFTGDNLLDVVQPVYALAGVQLDLAAADVAVAEAKARCNREELKFAELRYEPADREVMFQLFEAVDLGPQNARVCVAHKPWMVAAKMVDLLIEPRRLAQGTQVSWYASGMHVDTSFFLYGRGPDYLGEHWPLLQETFVTMVRRFRRDTATAYLSALSAARNACDNVVMGLVLAEMIDSWEELAENIPGVPDPLDPTPSCLFWQAGIWSDVSSDFAVIHDDSQVAARWAPQLARFETSPGRSMRVGDIVIKFPHGVRSISFVRSHDDSRVQVADLVAGASAWFYSAVAGLRPRDVFADELEAVGIGSLVQLFVGPAMAHA